VADAALIFLEFGDRDSKHGSKAVTVISGFNEQGRRQGHLAVSGTPRPGFFFC